MPFCSTCGAEISSNSKFCPQCGNKIIPTLSESESIPSPTEVTKSPLNPYELGMKLEEVVEKIFQADGYQTERRRRIQGNSKYTNEIDIIANRGEEKVAIECKNFSGPVGISMMRDFAQKLDDLGEGWRGIFIAYNDFTEDAIEFAECRNIERLGHDEIKERWFSVSVGRTVHKGEKLDLEDALPVNSNFVTATSLDLANKNKILVSDAKLVFYPYVRVPYHFKGQRKDPTRQTHHFEEKGIVVMDLLDGEVLNQRRTNDLKSLTSAIKAITSSEKHGELKRRQMIRQEIVENTPVRQYSITIGQDYQISKISAVYSLRDANRAAIQFIIENNTRIINYTVTRKDEFPEIKTMDFIPKRDEIKLFDAQIVLVPKWTIHFNAFGEIYSREMLACSGKILEDTMRHCPDHFKLGSVTVKKKNHAVCEICGKAKCVEHIAKCSVCGKWLCNTHAIVCSSCNRIFCEDHIYHTCRICKKPLCDSCLRTCPICNKEYGKDHALKCDRCGIECCPNCITISGLLRKTKTCKRCS